MDERCVHCGVGLLPDVPGMTTRSHLGHLHRCRGFNGVPYGHEAHAELPCPEWCSGSREDPCWHLVADPTSIHSESEEA